jgi:hypothetical protein
MSDSYVKPTAVAVREFELSDTFLTQKTLQEVYSSVHMLRKNAKEELGLIIPVSVYVQDPEVAKKNPDLGLQEIELDWEPNLMDGPTSAKIAVVDYDGDTNELHPPVRWDQATMRFFDPNNREVGRDMPNSHWFRQVNVWAVVQRVLNFYEQSWDGGLGRTIPWAFDGSRIIVVPHAGFDVNACYDRHSKSIQFYYCGTEKARDYSCLSHDIIAHETGHAVLDGIRPYYYEDTSLETRAFHEFVADLTAILMALRNNDVRHELEKLTEGKLEKRTFVSDLGETFGKHTKNREYVRTAVQKPKVTMNDLREGRSPHFCSQVLTGAMWDIIARMARKYIFEEKKSPTEALWDVIDHFRRIALWSLEFLPPVDVQFIDYARAVLRVHRLTHPQDRHGIREIMREIFEERGLTELEDATDPHNVHFRYQYNIDRVLRSRPDAYRFLNDHRRQLCIPAQQDFLVSDIYEANPAARGARRLPRLIVIQYAWSEDVELEDPEYGRFKGRRIRLWCGGTLVFDGRGNLLSWVRKPGTEEVKCAGGAKPHQRCNTDRAVGQQRKKKLLEHVTGHLQRGWVSLVSEDQADRVDVARASVVGRQTGGLLRLEAVPHLRHWGEGREE